MGEDILVFLRPKYYRWNLDSGEFHAHTREAMNLEGSAVSILKSTSPARLVGVLGMHRSGTSCLAGSLQEAGLQLGDCHTWNPHNLKGNRENQKFVDLHDAILLANGGAWDAPPQRAGWSTGHVAWAQRLLAEHAELPVFGFKDPRSLLVLDGWKAIYPSIEFVGIYRHPNAVVRSLEKRSAKSREDALDLWYAYNSLMYQEYKKKAFPILDFDDPEPVLDEKIFTVAGSMGLPGRSGDEKFYSPELRNTVDMDTPRLPWKVRRLYKKLKRVGL